MSERVFMSALGWTLPLAFLASTFWRHVPLKTSLSAYYWSDVPLERDVFVGVLCAVGAFLIAYWSDDPWERWVLPVGGVAVVLTALVPMSSAGDCGPGSHCSGIDCVIRHGVFATIFFGSIAIVCINGALATVKRNVDASRHSHFRWAYGTCAAAMVVAVCLAVATRVGERQWLCEHHAIFAFETVAIWSFAFYWYVKTRELDACVGWLPFSKRTPEH